MPGTTVTEMVTNERTNSHDEPGDHAPVTCEEDDMSSTGMIAVDPHKASNTAVVPDPATKTLIESARFANTADGYGQLARFAAGGSSGGGRWKGATGRAGRWPSGWSTTARWCWTCQPS